jgi:hypothetical protein
VMVVILPCGVGFFFGIVFSWSDKSHLMPSCLLHNRSYVTLDTLPLTYDGSKTSSRGRRYFCVDAVLLRTDGRIGRWNLYVNRQ